MKKKIIIPSAILLVIVIMIVSSLFGGGSKITIDCVPVSETLQKTKNVHLKVYVENSGSMDGYMCPGSNLKDAVFDYVSDLSKMANTCSYYYINSKIIPCNMPLNSYIQNLTPQSFAKAGGNRAHTDLRNMIDTILHNQDKNTVSIFVSDCILDIPENAIDFFGNCQVSIKNSFNAVLKQNPNLGVQIMKMDSKFDGYWYCSHNSELLHNVKRPYYIWVIGDKYTLADFNKKAPVNDILGGIKQYCAFSTSGKIPFDVDKKRYVVNHTGVVNVQMLVNLSPSLQNQDIIGNPSRFMTSDASARVTGIHPITADGSKYSHVLDVELSNPKSMKDITITFSIPKQPSWVLASNDDTGMNVKKNMDKTTGILYLINGVAEAYKNYTTYGTISFDVKNK
ncbi:hypothetical protein [uncultured Prevotella sp.]|uniref:hypothetical protein n=1 Tax=uncultured Prevotella sp. TaxID=159272 RepID=UPI0026198C5A|nr:hypothetical protein [uncultured Prevotella sp.]